MQRGLDSCQRDTFGRHHNWKNSVSIGNMGKRGSDDDPQYPARVDGRRAVFWTVTVITGEETLCRGRKWIVWKWWVWQTESTSSRQDVRNEALQPQRRGKRLWERHWKGVWKPWKWLLAIHFQKNPEPGKSDAHRIDSYIRAFLGKKDLSQQVNFTPE